MERNEIIKALSSDDFSRYYREADRIRGETKGDIVNIRAIIEITNICGRHCAYCGINAGNTKVRRYRMPASQIIDTAAAAVAAGYRTIVIQGGENPNGDVKEAGRIVTAIKNITEGIAVTLSLGEMRYEDYDYLRDCGADRYLLKHETSDPQLYKKLHPDGDLENRIQCLRWLKELGYETGSGFMIGLPGQTIESIADDLLMLRQLQCDMAGIGPFISHPDTPLRGCPNGDPELTKRAVAIARILLPQANLPVTTSLGVLSPEERKNAFACGANVIMKKATPDPYREDYEIYPAETKPVEISGDRAAIEKMLAETGRKGV